MKRRVKLAVNNPAWDLLLRAFLIKPVISALTNDQKRLVLEVGCGQGSTTQTLLKAMPNAFITAVDIDDEQILLAEKRIKDTRAEFLVEHAAEMSFDDESFDLVVTFNTLHHVPAWRKAVREAARVLKPGGRYALTGVCAAGLKFGPFRKFVAPRALIEPADFAKEAKKHGFRIENDFGGPRYMRLVLQKVRGKSARRTIDSKPSAG